MRSVWPNLQLALRREWRALVAALPPAHALVPRFGRIEFIFIGISVGVLLIAAIGGIVGVRKPAQAPSAEGVPPLGPAAQLAMLVEIHQCGAACHWVDAIGRERCRRWQCARCRTMPRWFRKIGQ